MQPFPHTLLLPLSLLLVSVFGDTVGFWIMIVAQLNAEDWCLSTTLL